MLTRARLLFCLVLCVSRAVLLVVLGAWSVRCVGRADWVDCRCFLSFVFLGDARRLELSPCDTTRTHLQKMHAHLHTCIPGTHRPIACQSLRSTPQPQRLTAICCCGHFASSYTGFLSSKGVQRCCRPLRQAGSASSSLHRVLGCP